tara:strand:- start:21541 stop:21720 length:180 start_codon:yes stop_codon:yes gene_type:complete
MKTKTITVTEYADRYGCSKEFVTRMLRKDTGMIGMVSWRKAEGKTGSWMIEVLISWYEK